jgi:[ribosomal protein S5]-alanine N-acetyltransferase
VHDSDRLTFSALVPGRDAEFIVKLLNEPDWLEFIGDRGVRTLADADRYIAEGPLAMHAKHGFSLLRCDLRASGEPVGICGLIQREWLPDPDVGFALLRTHSGRGLATEATRSTLVHAQQQLRLRRILAITAPHHVASQRVLQKCGLRPAGAVRNPAGELSSLYEIVMEPN